MKNLKTVLVTAVIVLLFVVLVLLAVKAFESQPLKETKSRIKQLKLVKEEQQLITDILNLRYDAALVRSKFSPAQPEPIPQPALPPELKE